MAWHDFDKASGFHRIGCYFGGKNALRSKTLKIRDERQAEAKCGVVEQTIRYLDDGVLAVPQGVEAGDFILSGGKLAARPVAVVPPKEMTLGAIQDQLPTLPLEWLRNLDKPLGVVGRCSWMAP